MTTEASGMFCHRVGAAAEAPISMFPSFSKQGLGRKSLVSHHIDTKSIKQRTRSRSAVGNEGPREVAKRLGFSGGRCR